MNARPCAHADGIDGTCPPRERWCPQKAIRVLERKKMFFLSSRKFIKIIFSSLIFLCCSVLNEKCVWYSGPLSARFSVGDTIWADVKSYSHVGGSTILEVALKVFRLGLFLVWSLCLVLWFKLAALCFLLACFCSAILYSNPLKPYPK